MATNLDTGIHTATRFAEALDVDDFATAASLLAPDCAYSISDVTHVGPDAIVASYRTASDWAHKNLDSIGYGSAVKPETAGRFLITFFDDLDHAGERMRHHCQQILSLNVTGLIDKIEHIDLPGEREAVDAFFKRVGIEREAD